MFEKVKDLEKRFEFLKEEIIKPEVIQHNEKWSQLCKEHAELEKIVKIYREYRENEESIKECEEILADTNNELAELAKEELQEAKAKQEKLVETLKIALIPTDENDNKNVVLEIRAGAGGEEAALFAAELLRMYRMYVEKMHWAMETIDFTDTDIEGFKEATVLIKGKGAYSKLKYESGVHRVQRVPETESQGRIHTSTVTVAVLPEAEDINVQIEEKDLKIDKFRASGAGGQHVNKTESAIRITHIPTGIVVTCQDEKSQFKNRDTAMKVLKSRIYDLYQRERDSSISKERRMQIGSGDRSERIRTYNFPQSRITDHRIGLTIHSLGAFLDGDISEMIEALQVADQKAKLSNLSQ